MDARRVMIPKGFSSLMRKKMRMCSDHSTTGGYAHIAATAFFVNPAESYFNSAV
jgi:hypothetical protein